MLPVEQPFKTYTGLDGKPLENGFVYFGQPNLNPVTAPVTVYWDAAGTIPAAQPLRTAGGYIMRAGTPANVFFDGAYSELVQDSKKRQVFFVRTSDEFSIISAVTKFITSLSAAAGASLLGFIHSAIGAVSRTVADKLTDDVSVFDFMNTIQKLAVKSNTGLLDVTAALQKAADHGGHIKMPRGIYLAGMIDLKGRSVMFIGEGVDRTTIKAAGTGIMFDIQETSDQVELPLVLSHMKLDGDGKATAGIKLSYRHKTRLENLTITDIDGDCLNEVNSWNNQRDNLTLKDSINGLVLQGANNNCRYSGLSFSGNTEYQIKIEAGGNPAGGSTAISFYNTDVEFASGYGIYVNTHGVVRFNDCYIGEQIFGKVFDMVAGMVVMTGGFAYFGSTPGSNLGYLVGGKLHFKNVNISGGASATVSNMFHAGEGKAYIEDSPCLITVAGVQVMNGDVLDYGRPYECFAPKLGREFAVNALNGTSVAVSTDNEITATCTEVTGSPCVLEVKATVAGSWLRNKPGSLVVVYKSTKPIVARLTNGPFGTTPDIDIGTLPSTDGQVKTAVLFSWVYFSNDGSQDVTTLELFQLDALVGDSFTISEVFLYDFKNGKAEDSVATFYNLGKA
jgi:hypothetical protein